ncbi:serine/threonine-protein kinase Sgk2 [Xylaria palmicola]|nr:serine/threonine-protein kinase Sgk2 [Xylaria palmicola]
MGSLPFKPLDIQNQVESSSELDRSAINSNSILSVDSEIRTDIEDELFRELKDNSFCNVGGCWDKFFKPKGEQTALLEKMMSAYNGEIWDDCPTVTDAIEAWNWLCSLEKQFWAGARYKLRTTNTINEFKKRKGEMDLFLYRSTKETTSGFSYKNVVVVGKQKKSNESPKENFLQIARHTRNVFTEQPTRRFVHAFTLCSSMLECWVFGRSGAYSSGLINIHERQRDFVRAFVGYSTMDDDTMGLDTFIRNDYIILDNLNGGEIKLHLGKRIAKQEAIISRGTTCYTAHNGCVAKFSWASNKQELAAEVNHLRLAKQKGVKGVARMVAHCRITTITEIREGLKFPKPYKFNCLLLDTGSANPLSSKHKLSGHTSDKVPGSKRRQSKRRKSNQAEASNNQPSISQEKLIPSPSESLWEDRTYSYIVVSPAGHLISNFRTSKELLESMRDAIKAHQSLYEDGEILHRDISPNNVIITDPEIADGWKGMLIDLDMAKVRGGPSGAQNRIGTTQFMAVGVLRAEDYTYRHDLESFFYVLIWACAHQLWLNGFGGKKTWKGESAVEGWKLDFAAAARQKGGDVSRFQLGRIMNNEFPKGLEAVRQLCLGFRDILFSVGEITDSSFETPTKPSSEVYDSIIEEFNKAIRNV